MLDILPALNDIITMSIDRFHETNPIGEKYAEVVTRFLAEYLDQPITPEVITSAAALLVSTECAFVGKEEAANELGVDPQHTDQLVNKLGPIAGQTSAGAFWLRDQVIQLGHS